MIDKLNLTIYVPPDRNYPRIMGKISEDQQRLKFINLCVNLDKAIILYPHKFTEEVNLSIAFTKIDINPKYFECL